MIPQTLSKLVMPSMKPAAYTIPLTLNTAEFLEWWDKWVSDRKARRQPITSLAADLQLRQLEAMGPVKAVKSIQQSIACGYRGLFEPREEHQAQPRLAKPRVSRGVIAMEISQCERDIATIMGRATHTALDVIYEPGDKEKLRAAKKRLQALRDEQSALISGG